MKEYCNYIKKHIPEILLELGRGQDKVKNNKFIELFNRNIFDESSSSSPQNIKNTFNQNLLAGFLVEYDGKLKKSQDLSNIVIFPGLWGCANSSLLTQSIQSFDTLLPNQHKSLYFPILEQCPQERFESYRNYYYDPNYIDPKEAKNFFDIYFKNKLFDDCGNIKNNDCDITFACFSIGFREAISNLNYLYSYLVEKNTPQPEIDQIFDKIKIINIASPINTSLCNKFNSKIRTFISATDFGTAKPIDNITNFYLNRDLALNIDKSLLFSNVCNNHDVLVAGYKISDIAITTPKLQNDSVKFKVNFLGHDLDSYCSMVLISQFAKKYVKFDSLDNILKNYDDNIIKAEFNRNLLLDKNDIKDNVSQMYDSFLKKQAYKDLIDKAKNNQNTSNRE